MNMMHTHPSLGSRSRILGLCLQGVYCCFSNVNRVIFLFLRERKNECDTEVNNGVKLLLFCFVVGK